MNELNCRIESLEIFLKIKWDTCPSDDCYMGKQISSYSDNFPCPKCKGSGKVHNKLPTKRKKKK